MNGGRDIARTIRHRPQKGRLFQRHGSWHVGYYAWTKDTSGEPTWRERFSALGRIKDFPKQRDIWDTYQGFMDQVNLQFLRERGRDSPFVSFVEQTYLESETVKALSESTRDEYIGIWKRWLRERMKDETLEGVRPVTVHLILEAIVTDHDLSKTTLGHIKAFLSGVYSYARNHGHFDGANPVTGVKLPKARSKSETYAYDLAEEQEILKVLELREKAAVATASYAGLAKAEMQGFRWEDRKNGVLHIRRNVWSGIEKETKTAFRRAAVPIIPQLEQILSQYWKSIGCPDEGWVWPNKRGRLPMDFNNLYRRHMKDRLEQTGLSWYGWHSFRRGLASNLSELGVPDDVIQQIMRHGDLGTTQKFYRKTRRPAVNKAMKRLSRKLGKVR